MKIREFNIPNQGEDERIAYKLDTEPWEGYTSGEIVVIKDSDGTDVSDTHLSGSPSESDGVISTPLVIDLTAGEIYRLEILWVSSGNTFEAFGILEAET